MTDERDEPKTEGEEHRASVADDIRAAMAQLETEAPTAEAAESASDGSQASEGREAATTKQVERAPLDKKQISTESAKRASATKTDNATQEGKPSQEQEPLIAAPISWSADKQEAFATLPRDVQKYIVDRESERDRFVQQKAQEYAQATRESEGLLEEIRPYLSQFQRQRMNPAEAIGYLLKANDFLVSNPKEAIRRLAEMHGVNLDEVAQEVPSVDPEIHRLRQELDELRGVYSGQQEQAEQRYVAQLSSYLNQFTSAADEKGNSKFPHLKDPNFENAMSVEVRKLRALHNDSLPLDQLLTTAYENTVWTIPTLRDAELKKRQGIAEARRISEEKAKAEQARRMASSVSGAPSGAARASSSNGSVRGDIEAAFNALGY